MNLGTTMPAGLVMYDVKRTTTDKLEAVLNEYAEGWSIDQVVHVGGRDWVVIASSEFASEADRNESFGLPLGA